MKVMEVDRGPGLGKGLVKHWTDGVEIDENTIDQARKMAQVPFIYKHIALMPDCHLGKGATVGSVIPTKKAIIPAAVGVDLGCGMMALKLDLKAEDLPESLARLRIALEAKVPVGNGKGGNHKEISNSILRVWHKMSDGFEAITEKHRPLRSVNNPAKQIGTLGGGNHFIEVCLDEKGQVWLMLHSGSRGVGNQIGMHFISLARKEMERFHIHLPDRDLAYLPEGSDYFDDYWAAVRWAQEYALINREVMMERILTAVREELRRPVGVVEKAINCHHNYVALENHFGENVYVTRKGAIRAREGELGIIPGSMGACSYIVRGLGNEQSFHSCSHGAGRVMSRSEAKRRFNVADHRKATAGVECRKDEGVIDETPMAYKNIAAVMRAQSDLVEPVATLSQVVCVKG